MNQQNVTRLISDTRIGGAEGLQNIPLTFGTDRKNVLSLTYTDVSTDSYISDRNILVVSPETNNMLNNLIYNGNDVLDMQLNCTYYPKSYLFNIAPDCLWDRDPTMYPGIDTSLNPNPVGTKKRWVSISSLGNISDPQLDEMWFHGNNMNGQHYYDASGNPYDGPVEFVSFGQFFEPYTSGGNYNETTTVLGPTHTNNEYLHLSTGAGTYPVIIPIREESIAFQHDTTKSMTNDTDTAIYQQDFCYRSDLESFHQDIGFTIENLVTDPSGAASFAALGGTNLFGQVVFHNAPTTAAGQGGIDASGNVKIPSPSVMPNFFDKTTWRSRILEKAIFITNLDDWKDYSFIRNSSPNNTTGVSSLALGPANGSKFVPNNASVVPISENVASVKF